jgi:hypothetical protein
MWKRKESILKLNSINSAFGLKEFSSLNLSKIQKLNFPRYNAKKLGDNFAYYFTCDMLHSLQKAAILGSHIATFWS